MNLAQIKSRADRKAERVLFTLGERLPCENALAGRAKAIERGKQLHGLGFTIAALHGLDAKHFLLFGVSVAAVQHPFDISRDPFSVAHQVGGIGLSFLSFSKRGEGQVMQLSGKRYEWEASSNPLDGSVASPLPEWIRDLSGAAQVKAGGEVGPALPIDEKRLSELRQALPYIIEPDRDTWLAVGFALHNDIGGQFGFDLWDQ